VSLPRPEQIDALLLDLDDTILDDRAGIRLAQARVTQLVASRREGLSADAFQHALLEASAWYWSDAERERVGRLDLTRARYRIVRDALARCSQVDAALAQEAAELYTRSREESYRVADGALAALEALRARFARLALVTNGQSGPQRAKLERFALGRWFDHIQVEGEFGLGKPEPAVFRHAAAALGADPARCLMVGDNFRADVLGSLAVGMHAAWIAPDPDSALPAPAPRPFARVATLAELAARLCADG
jgi:putative hydrolase of the HAD superfamily